MLIFLLIFLSFAQAGLLGLGGNAGTQAILEHEIITLHAWFSPAQMADLMSLCRILPGGTGLNAANLASSMAVLPQLGFGGAAAATLTATAALSLPAIAWTAVIGRAAQMQRYKDLAQCAMTLLRPLTPGLIAGAALLMVCSDTLGADATTPWDLGVSLFLFASTIIGVAICRFNAGFMVILCGLAGWILL